MLDRIEPRPIDLRDYQSQAVEELRAGIRAGRRRQILVAATSFGKTECAAHIIQQSMSKGASAWFIVDRIALIDQTSERFSSYGIDHGIIQAKHWLTALWKPIQIASAQTIARRRLSDLPDYPDLIVVDECHAQYKSTLDLMATAKNAKIIGLTATPFSNGMDAHWDAIINGMTVSRLLKREYLCPVKVKACIAPDMEGVRKTFTGEWDDEESGQRGMRIVGDVVSTWVEQTRAQFGGPVKTIVFSPSVRHGAELCRQFAEAGYNFQQISYLDRDDDARREKIAEFRKENSAIDGLVSCAVLTKGFDVPDVRCGISCRPYRKSLSSHVQELGRVMRIAPGKDFALWLDHSGNCISFADDVADLYENGVESLSSACAGDSKVREPDQNIRRERFCVDCGFQMEPRQDVCGSCGWQRPQRGEIEIVDGTLHDIDLYASRKIEARSGLRAECLADPRGVWNAALVYTMAAGRRDEEASRKWAYGIWAGIYPGSKLPRGLFDARPDGQAVTQQQWALIEREIARFRRSKPKRKRAA